MSDGPLAVYLLRGMRVAQSMVLMAILFLLDLPSLLVSLDLYASPLVGLGWYAAMVVPALADTAVGTRQRFWGPARWPAAAYVLAVSWGASAALPPEALLGPAHWTFGVVGWFGLLLFVDSPIRTMLGFIALHLALTVVQVAMAGQLDEAGIRLATVVVGVTSYQLAVVIATVILRKVAEEATAAAVLRAETATRESVARDVHARREARYAALRDTAVPLLRGIADGTHPPADPPVQRRAAIEAARMRRLFGEQGDDGAPLAGELAALVDVVERRGVAVRYAARPVVVEPPPDARRAMVEAVSGILLGPTRSARVTVGGTGAGVTVSVVAEGEFDGPDDTDQETAVHTSTIVDDGRTWVEARWVIP